MTADEEATKRASSAVAGPSERTLAPGRWRTFMTRWSR